MTEFFICIAICFAIAVVFSFVTIDVVVVFVVCLVLRVLFRFEGYKRNSRIYIYVQKQRKSNEWKAIKTRDVCVCIKEEIENRNAND